MTSQSSQRRSSSASWMSKGKSRLLVAQVMTIGVTSVEEQPTQDYSTNYYEPYVPENTYTYDDSSYYDQSGYYAPEEGYDDTNY